MNTNEVIVTVHSTKDLEAVDKNVFRYTAEPVVRKYTEDTIDEATGEVVTIEHYEPIYQRGIELSPDNFSEILFYLQSDVIQEVRLSNVQRLGTIVSGMRFRLWTVKVDGQRKLKMLLRADNALLAYEVAKDYIELNYVCTFSIEGIKTFADCIVIEPEKDEGKRNISAERRWYKVDTEALQQDPGAEPVHLSSAQFVVFAENVESAKVIIDRYIAEWNAKNERNINNVVTRTNAASVISCDVVVPAEFCMAYTKRKEEE